LQVTRIAVLERSALANLDGDGTEVCREAVQSWKFGFAERWHVANEAGEVVLAFGLEALDSWNALGPEAHEGDEYCRAVGEGEVVPRGRFFTAGKRDG
jgi:hypothetical protein